jgi:hypothetical protein
VQRPLEDDSFKIVAHAFIGMSARHGMKNRLRRKLRNDLIDPILQDLRYFAKISSLNHILWN